MKKILFAALLLSGFMTLSFAQSAGTQPAATSTSKPLPKKPLNAPIAATQNAPEVAAKSSTVPVEKRPKHMKKSASTVATQTKKDGTPDKRYAANKHLKADGTKDLRYKDNKTSTSPAPKPAVTHK